MSSTIEVIKDWQIEANLSFADQGTGIDNAKALLLLIVNTLLAFDVSAPTVVGSSDGTTGACDAVNRWTDASKLSWDAPGSSHSWIVLRFPGGFQLLIDLGNVGDSGEAEQFQIWASYAAGFTGGSATSRPTATDQHQVFGGNDSTWGGSRNSTVYGTWTPMPSAGHALHVWLAEDESGFRVAAFADGVAVTTWLLQRVDDPPAGWTTPYVFALWCGDGTHDGPRYHDWYTPFGGLRSEVNTEAHGQQTIECGLSTRACGCALGQQQTAPHPVDGTYPLTEVGLWSASTYTVDMSTVSLTGDYGELTDVWATSEAPMATGGTYPNDTSRQLVQIGDMAWPWNGSSSFLTAAP